MKRIFFPLIVLCALVAGVTLSSCVCCSPKKKSKSPEKAVCDIKKDVDKKYSDVKKDIKKETKKK